ncbi:meiotic recombination protein SPO11, putative (SPO11) [Plasmodium ovale curtisi]|uniref:Meiotic recombination protein SPO11, putative (SPO11) n=1 Tax=Plasmodium ovale curtisi TaxID=864141 RepID=A0A1A8W9P5_PLAOA|nr:meiotic recombination protein SPO11, putative (SPO11) [Plasmodium ovale curtisi]SBS98277.1 meiotic recombination protein SPO11, putative (SPO11) [Plasmodium ovale curtisi]
MDDNSDVICLLEKYVFDFLLKLVDKKKKNCISKSKIIETTRLFYTIEIVWRNVKDHIYTTLRQIFYTNPQLFISQNVSNRTIGKLTKIVKKPRELLNIYNSPKGIIRGNMLLRERNLSAWVDCMSVFEVGRRKNEDWFSPFSKGPLNMSIWHIRRKNSPRYINTRQLIFEIHRRNRRIMFFCLTDYDAYDVEDISIDRLRWLNLFTPEKAIEENVLKEIDLSKLTSKDIRILDKFSPMAERNGENFTIPMRIYVHECIVSAKLKSSNKFRTVEAKHWMEHINNMKKSGFKYEIDTIADMEKHLDARINELLRT